MVFPAISQAEKTGKLTRTLTVSLLQGGKGFATYQPIYDDQQQLIGFVNGVFLVDTLINRCFGEPTLRKRYFFAIYENDGQLIYPHNN
ncbi:hypothetical protein B6D60_08385 [candidate division KSB1 bacterium 4484_87]|nr:MAG: hypothetical protein B6D60_08385 [candidate division KSB1 bacterium 4484_87]